LAIGTPVDVAARTCNRNRAKKMCPAGHVYTEEMRVRYAKSGQYTRVCFICQKERRLLNRDKLLEYLLSHPCVDCGESDPIVLEFDHINGNKIANVSSIKNTKNWDQVLAEIAKCEVRCANCHRRRTASQFLWWKRLG
jgi:hypothetical protein